MLPFFIVKDKTGARRRTQCHRAGRDSDVTRTHRAQVKLNRHGESEGLPGVAEGLVVHVVVKSRELGKIGTLVAGRSLLQQGKAALEHRLRIAARRTKVGQVEIPARVVGHARRVIPAIGMLEQRGQRKIAAAVQPEFLEPGEMAQFPYGRIDDTHQRHLGTLRGKARGQLLCRLMRFRQPRAQGGRVRMRPELRKIRPAGAVRRLCYIALRPSISGHRCHSIRANRHCNAGTTGLAPRQS